jgi:hypothetical protein
VLLRRVDVRPHKDLVVFVRLQLLVDEALIVETVAQHEGVWDRPLQELGGDVRQVGLIVNLVRGNKHHDYDRDHLNKQKIILSLIILSGLDILRKFFFRFFISLTWKLHKKLFIIMIIRFYRMSNYYYFISE